MIADPFILVWVAVSGVLAVSALAVTDYAAQETAEGEAAAFGFAGQGSGEAGRSEPMVTIGQYKVPARAVQYGAFTIAAAILVFFVGIKVLYTMLFSLALVLAHALFRDAAREQLELRESERVEMQALNGGEGDAV